VVAIWRESSGFTSSSLMRDGPNFGTETSGRLVHLPAADIPPDSPVLGVHDGVANGYLNTTNINPTIGVRYKF
jgi:hypothetical protein